MNYRLITTQDDFFAAIADLKVTNPLAVDMEMENNLHHYGLHLALIQAATPANAVYIFDPLQLHDLSPLGALLSDGRHELIMHGADFDRRACFQLYGWILNTIFDTQIAALFCSLKRTGLASILEELFGIKVDKKFQKQDWMKRPLGKPALEYAAQDVGRLHSIRDLLAARLIEAHRLEWVKEEFTRCGQTLGFDVQLAPHVRIKHSASLNPRQLAILKSLCAYRENVARELDMPPQFIIRDSLMIEIARRAPRDEHSIKALKGLHPRLYRRKEMKDMLAAVASGRNAPEEDHPAWHHKRLPLAAAGWEKRLKEMRAWRLAFAADLDIEPHLVLDNDVMEWCARHPGQKLPPLIAGLIRNWQTKLFWHEFRKKFC
jgi:ribonuclease D